MVEDVTKRLQSEKALSASKKQFRSLRENIPIGIFRSTPEGKIVSNNTANVKMFGCETQEEFLRLNSKDLYFYPNQRKKLLRKLEIEKSIEDFELKLKRKDGSILWVLCGINSILDESGKLIFLDGVNKDITERKIAEQALDKSEALYSALFHHNPIQTVVVDNNCKVIALNNAKKISGDRLPKVGEIMYKDYAGHHNTDMLKELKKCISSKKLREFPEQTYKDKMLSIKISPFDGGAIITSQDITLQKIAENELIKSEATYRLLAENTTDVIWTSDFDLNCIYCSPSIKYLRGYTADEVKNQSIKDILTPESLEEALITLKNEMINEEKGNFKLLCIEMELIHKNGSTVMTESTITVVYDKKGKPLNILGVTRDISKRKKAEAELRHSEEKYRLITNNMLDMVSMTDPKYLLSFVSPSHKTILGYSAEDLLGKPVFEYVYPDDLQFIISQMKKNADSTEPISSVFRHQHKNGHYVWLETNGHNIFDSNGNLIGAVFGSRDITYRKKAEEKIEHLNELLLAIRSANHLMTKEKNSDKIIQGICESLVKSRGHSNVWIALLDESSNVIKTAESGLGQNFSDYIKNYTDISRMNCVRNAIDYSKVVIIDRHSSYCKDCPIIPIDTNAGRMVISLEYNNRKYGIINVGVDFDFISEDEEKSLLKEVADDIAFALYNIELEKERKTLQKQLFRSARLSAVGQLAAGVAHEFNNLLSVILGHTQLSIEENSIVEIKKSLKEIERTTKRGSSIVVKLGAFAKPKDPDFVSQDISIVLDEVIVLQKRQLRLESIQIEKKYGARSRTLVDHDQIEQVFLNLLINAIHAIKQKGGGKISISISDEGSYVKINFSDNGIGMEKATILKIFDPFFTTKGAWANNSLGISGTGLGLSIAHSIIKQHNGTISAKSSINNGTTFTIKLPIDKTNEISVSAPNIKIPEFDIEKIKQMKILLVDDEEDMIDLMKQIFKKTGFENIIIESSGETALSVFKKFHPDIVFLDIVMPDMNGEQIFEKIKSIDNEIPVVFMSGKLDMHKGKFLEKGAFDFIQKPFDINEFFNILNRIIKVAQ